MPRPPKSEKIIPGPPKKKKKRHILIVKIFISHVYILLQRIVTYLQTVFKNKIKTVPSMKLTKLSRTPGWEAQV